LSWETGVSIDLLSKSAKILASQLLKIPLSKLENVSQEKKIKEVSEWFESESLVLVLGAGASASYGLPDWNLLLQKLLLISLESEGESTKDEIDEKSGVLAKTFSRVFEPNSLITARYLHNHFKEKQPRATLAFETAIRDALYIGVDIDDESELMKEIRKLCIAAGRSPNLDSIITYNYDDILERCLKNIEVDIPFKSIHASGMKNARNELAIYHVHGYLPSTGNLTSKNKVVLSEDGYHQQYSDVYGWSNLIQINKFKDHNCIFIGLSFTDPNLRRLLDISKKERGDDEIHHYCIKKRFTQDDVENRLKKLLSENNEILEDKIRAELDLPEFSNELINLMEKFEENDANSFGVGIIWVSSYEDIPSVLSKIRTNGAL
tara:strand:+ start:510 stop:1643 length:1134 start_codon:yes stop_codon:yes gene_type:complete